MVHVCLCCGHIADACSSQNPRSFSDVPEDCSWNGTGTLAVVVHYRKITCVMYIFKLDFYRF